ncbi:MAG: dihydroxyacetone kinase subunit DhaL [Lachnospiraceae bacterium]|nr:dihydroxyacetone kinase subunit DhaL [Lachnospiraceae bacterium]
MKTINVVQSKEMIIKVCDAIIANKPYLTEVDSKIGDGDHGIGMAGGMEKAKAALLGNSEFATVNEVFKTTGMQMLNSMGGASGVIFGSMFLGGVKGLDPITELDGEIFTKMMRASVESIKARGKAQMGDKTMVDAFEPAVEAMEKAEKSDLTVLLEEAAKAAKQGVEDTKEMIAKFGRAKSLMERAVGYQDAGATSVQIIFETMYEYVKLL